MAGPETRSFHTLDGLRGVAALLIIARHAPALFAGIEFPHSYLAVDLFFVLSGFVIAHAYDAKLAHGGFAGRFIALRLIRLYPLYLLGLAAGTVYTLLLIAGGTAPEWTHAKLGAALAANLLFLPAPPSSPEGSFPIDGPTWTLMLELGANIAYALLFRLLTTRVLVGIVLIAGAVYGRAVLGHGSADIGYQRDLLLEGLARVAFGFGAGMLLYRHGVLPGRARPVQAWAALAGLALLLALPVPAAIAGIYDLACALLLFPLLVWRASRAEPRGASATAVMATLGALSYAIYVLHEPLARLATLGVAAWSGVDVRPAASWSGLVFLGCLVALCLALDRIYDKPLRRWLRARLGA